MLRELHIRDFALIENSDIEFSSGFNVITGETGAGKSILIGALGLILGERASVEEVRVGAEKCRVEGIFDLSGNERILKTLEELGVEVEDELILRREVTAGGRGQCFANDRTITTRTLKAIGDLLVDLHGQHEHQALLRVETHLELLDRFGRLEEGVDRVEHAYRRLMDLKRTLRELEQRKQSVEERKELYAFQLKEITDAKPEPGELEQLDRERTILENSEQLIQATQGLAQLLYDGEDSIVDRLGLGESLLTEAAGADPGLAEKVEVYRSLIYQIEDLASFFRSYAEQVEVDPYRLEEVRERIALLKRLEKKYGGTLEAVLKRRAFLEKQMGIAENLDEEIARVEAQIREASRTFSRNCVHLSEQRQQVAGELAAQIERALDDLGMGEATFEVRLERKEDPEGLAEVEGKRCAAGPKGIERCAFYISTNVGEEKKPLVRVVSGGEISRIMLALKSILAEVDAISTSVFDEIDIGISGRIAEAVGRKLKSLSKARQTISITHLPQIASLADTHFVVKKEVRGDRTISQVIRLREEERTEELARLLGGEQISELTRQHAEEMLKHRWGRSNEDQAMREGRGGG